jgi:site-specific recombinase XerD
MTRRNFDYLLKSLFRDATDYILEEDKEAVVVFKRASIHWLRHIHATHALAKGVSLKNVQDYLGHASLSTT